MIWQVIILTSIFTAGYLSGRVFRRCPAAHFRNCEVVLTGKKHSNCTPERYCKTCDYTWSYDDDQRP
jgi:hypothetical protein